MDTIYKNYIRMHGNFSHILNVELDTCLSEDEKQKILSNIYDLINEKEIKKNISNIDMGVKWRTYDNDLYHYYTDGNGILSDEGIRKHTKLLLDDINQIENSDKFKIIIRKPLTKSICIM